MFDDLTNAKKDKSPMIDVTNPINGKDMMALLSIEQWNWNLSFPSPFLFSSCRNKS